MGLSSTLLLIAALTAGLPLLATRLRPPASIRDVEKSFVVAIVTLVVGTAVVRQIHGLTFFGLAHQVYLLAVVTLPGLLGGWWLLSVIRRQRTLLLRIGGLAGLLIALVGVWATHIEPNWLRLDRVTAVAAVDQPLTIGVLADLQTPNVGKHERRAVDMLLAEAPDIVVVPGDLFQGNGDLIQSRRADFSGLLASLVGEVLVVAVVSGDSDNPGLLKTITEDAGALFLDNQITEITVAGQAVRLAGVAVEQSPDRLTTIADLGTPSDAFTVLVSHRPGVVFDLPLGTDVDLIVSGHTHGGQVAIPAFGPIVTFSDIPRKLAAGGIGTVDNFVVYVSTGVGLERKQAPQIRFNTRPSVGLIEVTPE